jgi:hypothetical protein
MSKGGRSKHQDDAIKRYFDGMPVKDATDNLRVFVNRADIKTARRKDPGNCVYANACKRLYGSSAILFFRTIAYVDLPDEQGNRVVNRFHLNARVRGQIAEFDKTGIAHPGGFLLSAPPHSGTLEVGRAYTKARKKALLMGERVVVPGNKMSKKNHTSVSLVTDVRDGTGMAHFIEKTT